MHEPSELQFQIANSVRSTVSAAACLVPPPLLDQRLQQRCATVLRPAAHACTAAAAATALTAAGAAWLPLVRGAGPRRLAGCFRRSRGRGHGPLSPKRRCDHPLARLAAAPPAGRACPARRALPQVLVVFLRRGRPSRANAVRTHSAGPAPLGSARVRKSALCIDGCACSRCVGGGGGLPARTRRRERVRGRRPAVDPPARTRTPACASECATRGAGPGSAACPSPGPSLLSCSS
jgi:hypothetical protein